MTQVQPVSIHLPKYPASRPPVTPMTMAVRSATSAPARLNWAPKSSRERTSRPAPSVPSRFPRAGRGEDILYHGGVGIVRGQNLGENCGEDGKGEERQRRQAERVMQDPAEEGNLAPPRGGRRRSVGSVVCAGVVMTDALSG